MTISYEDWVEKIFNHSVSNEHWFWGESELYDKIENSLSDVEKINYLTRLFENTDKDISKFNDTQINDGLNYLVSNIFSNYMFAWINKEVTTADRKKFIESIYRIFTDFMANRCNERLSHLGEKDAHSINYICYMWWDLIPIHPVRSFSMETDKMFLDVMKRTIAINNIACQESALRGLGYWHSNYPEIVGEIIDGYIEKFSGFFVKKKGKVMLKNSEQELPKILIYARNARTGNIQ